MTSMVGNQLYQNDAVDVQAGDTNQTPKKEKPYHYDTPAHIAKTIVSVRSQVMMTMSNKERPTSGKSLVSANEVSVDSTTANTSAEKSYMRTKYRRYYFLRDI